MTKRTTTYSTMQDGTALRLLVRHYGSVAKAAEAMKMSETRLANWRVRGISNEGRPIVWRALREIGVKLPVEWALAHEHDYSNFGGEADGRTGEAQRA